MIHMLCTSPKPALKCGGILSQVVGQPGGRMRKAALGKLEPYEVWQNEIRLSPAPQLAFSSWPEEMFFTRMLYSCLVDADFLDTSGA